MQDSKDKVTKGEPAAPGSQLAAVVQIEQEDVGMWDDTMEGGLIFEKAAAELRQSDSDKKAGAGSLSRVVRAASLNKLVELLTSDEEHGTQPICPSSPKHARSLIERSYFVVADPRFTPMLLTTYRSFTTPQRLLKKLRERYNVPASAGLPAYALSLLWSS
jgi:hypothetical protein